LADCQAWGGAGLSALQSALAHTSLPPLSAIKVPDLDLARVFYAEGLGLTADPDTLGWQRGGPFVTWCVRAWRRGGAR
jgi:hypothetical protein